MPGTKKFDVFLSHHSSDKIWVEKLKDALEAHNISVWLDKDHIRPGDHFAKDLEEGLKSSKNILFVVTKKSMKSKWVEEEYYRALSLSKSKRYPARLIPIVLQASKMPGFLESRNWIDFTNESEFDENIKKLILEITGQIQKQEKKEFVAAKPRYFELALKAYDIIDLGNLPDQDIRIATQRLELRNLYVSLHVRTEYSVSSESLDFELEAIEKRRKESLKNRGVMFGQEAKPDRKLEFNVVPIGERLTKSRRLVVLGDPGSGKTTLIKWIATAYLLRLTHDKDWQRLPDIETLPDEEFFPIVIRCRDLPPACLNGSLDDILFNALRKLELTETECIILREGIREYLGNGKGLLLIDGLDEVTDSGLRSLFCKQIERIHDAYPSAPIIVTSRIVGYREMGYRITRGFEHVTVANLSEKDKELFVHRWYDVTEMDSPPERRLSEAKGLIESIKSNEQLQHLTSNPMMLTTLALVKRKVGKLPNHRARLYWEAVQVLLNWRHEVDAPIEDKEALPQLEYLAYSMCDAGVQQYREDEIIDNFERMRAEYPNIHAVRQHDPHEFLRLLIRRTGILVDAGYVYHRGIEVVVYEFKHLTFQEYLAGLSLARSHFPGYQPAKSLAQYISPLVSRIRLDNEEVREQDNWREALRLCVASCNDSDVDSLLEAILTVREDEKSPEANRLRSVEATLCLADDVSASELTAREILEAFAKEIRKIDGTGNKEKETDIDRAALEMANAKPHWLKLFQTILVEEFCRRESFSRQAVGGLIGMVMAKQAPIGEQLITSWVETHVARVAKGELVEAIESALAIMHLAWSTKISVTLGMIDNLLLLLYNENLAAQHAAAWALGWLNNQKLKGRAWRPNPEETEKLIGALKNVSLDPMATRCITWIFREYRERNPRAVEPLIKKLDQKIIEVLQSVIFALGVIQDVRSISPLIQKLDDPSPKIRREIAEALGNIGDRSAVHPLLILLEKDQDRFVRASAADALGKIGDPQAIKGLIQATKGTSSSLQMTALQILSQIELDPEDNLSLDLILETIASCLDDKDSDTQNTAADLLGQVIPKSKNKKLCNNIVEKLLYHLDDSNDLVRLKIVKTLGKIQNPRAVEKLLVLLDDPNKEVKYASAISLGEIKDGRAFKPLLDRIEDVGMRPAIVSALGEIGDMRATEHLVKLLSHPDSYVRYYSTHSLIKLNDNNVLSHIVEKFNEPDATNREAILEAYVMLSKGMTQVSRKLLSSGLDGSSPFIDVMDVINDDRVVAASEELEITIEEIRNNYEELAKQIPIKLAWL